MSGSQPQPGPIPPIPLPVGAQGWQIPRAMAPLQIPAQFGMAVVGESLHQPALRRAAGGRVADVSDGHFENAIPVTACLVPEPGNPDDPNAVAVTVGEELVGYLPAATARTWQPVLVRAWGVGRYIRCAGSISGGGPQRSYGIFLTVCRPIEVEFVVDAPSGTWPVIGSASVTVVGEDQHPGSLAGLRPHEGVAATLHRVGSRREAGERVLEVRIDGNRVGELTPAMSGRYAGLVAQAERRGVTLACRAHISEDHRGKQVTLSLPTEEELIGT